VPFWFVDFSSYVLARPHRIFSLLTWKTRAYPSVSPNLLVALYDVEQQWLSEQVNEWYITSLDHRDDTDEDDLPEVFLWGEDDVTAPAVTWSSFYTQYHAGKSHTVQTTVNNGVTCAVFIASMLSVRQWPLSRHRRSNIAQYKRSRYRRIKAHNNAEDKQDKYYALAANLWAVGEKPRY